MKSISTILCLLLLIISCTPQKRLNRLLEKYPALSSSALDTVTIETIIPDTFYLPAAPIEGVWPYSESPTWVMDHERWNLTGTIDTVNKIIYLDGECKADTITEMDTAAIQCVYRLNQFRNWNNQLSTELETVKAKYERARGKIDILQSERGRYRKQGMWWTLAVLAVITIVYKIIRAKFFG